MFVGATGVGRVVQRTLELMREHDTDDVQPFGGLNLDLLQKYVNFHYSVSLDLFGSETSTNAANYFGAGIKGRFQEERRDDDHKLKTVYRNVPNFDENGVGTREVTQLSALNETLRDDYAEDCQKGMDRWNRAIDEAGVNFALTLPHVGFNRQVGTFRDAYISPNGTSISATEWAAQRRPMVAHRCRSGVRQVAHGRGYRARQDGRLGRPTVTWHSSKTRRVRLRTTLGS